MVDGKVQEKLLEYIHPYLVQYNESFYDFLIRTANRCGEFVYYENGEFHLGLASSSERSIENYSSLTYHRFMRRENTDEDFTRHRNYYDIPGTYEEEHPYNFEGPADEFLEPLKIREGSDGWADEALFPEYAIVSTISSALSEATLSEMIVAAGVNLGLTVLNTKLLATNLNKRYNENLDAHLKDEKEEKEKRWSSDKKEISQFSTYRKNGAANLNCLLFSEIRKKELEAEREAIHIDLATNYTPLSLGDIITVNGSQYIITQINGSAAVSQMTGEQRNSDNWVETLEVDAVLYKDKSPYPPMLSSGTVRKSGSQLAYVTDNKDPLRLGRVRIRYPWQLKIEDEKNKELWELEIDGASPWVRVARPMATKDGGFNFIFSVGDEVWVGYENGNIERPYVIGAVHSPEQVPGTTSMKGVHHTIASANGHTMVFHDPSSGRSFLTNMSPSFKLLATYIPALAQWTPDFTKGDFKGLAGGIEFYDNYGMYSISMSSDKRAVNIDSPLGKVEINAFTGITISAPNGNVSIEGKNVSIIAGNKLTLTSGQNIDNGFGRLGGLGEKIFKGGGKKFAENAGAVVGKAVLDNTVNKFVSLVDFKLIRTLIETFLRPVGGQMLIKSYRYMHLEAGDGEVKKPLEYYAQETKQKMLDEAKKRKPKISIAREVLRQCDDYIVSCVNIWKEKGPMLTGILDSFKESSQRPSVNSSGLNKGILINAPEGKIKSLIKEALKDGQEDSKSPSCVKDAKKIVKEIHNALLSEGMSKIENDETVNELFGLCKNKFLNNDGDIKLLLSFSEEESYNRYKELCNKEHELRRNAAYMAINILKKEEYIDFEEELTNFNDLQSWTEWVNKLDLPKDKENFLMGTAKEAGKYIYDKSGIKGLKETITGGDEIRIWNPVQKGEILFSDKEGKYTVSMGRKESDPTLVAQINNTDVAILTEIQSLLIQY